MLKSFANDKRLKLLSILSGGRTTFGNLQTKVNLSKTALSHHLEGLMGSNLICQMSRGNYEISHDGSELLRSVVSTFINTQKRKEEAILKKSNYILRTHEKRENKMNEFNVRIVELEPMQVASVRVISKSPENDAWLKLREWAKPRKLLDTPDKHPVFGFNNPNPSKDKAEYGYEFWIQLDPEVDYGASEEVEFKKFEGGKFAVATSKLKEDIDTDGVLKTWKNLVSWIETSEYKISKEVQCLERALQPDTSEDDLVLDLYLPLEKKYK